MAPRKKATAKKAASAKKTAAKPAPEYKEPKGYRVSSEPALGTPRAPATVADSTEEG